MGDAKAILALIYCCALACLTCHGSTSSNGCCVAAWSCAGSSSCILCQDLVHQHVDAGVTGALKQALLINSRPVFSKQMNAANRVSVRQFSSAVLCCRYGCSTASATASTASILPHRLVRVAISVMGGMGAPSRHVMLLGSCACLMPHASVKLTVKSDSQSDSCQG